MPSPSQILRSARPVFRNTPSTFFTSRAQAQSQAFRFAGFRSKFGQGLGRRWQSTAAEAQQVKEGVKDAVQQGWIRRMWDSPIGVKTVHFWAPVMKWCIVIAGISDFYRPAENLSLTQNVALTCTGIIWTRWCLIIKPRNILLATVNFFLGVVGVIQVSRIFSYRYSDEGKAAAAKLAEVEENVVESATELKGEIKDVVKV